MFEAREVFWRRVPGGEVHQATRVLQCSTELRAPLTNLVTVVRLAKVERARRT